MQLLKLRYFQLKRDLGYWVILIAAASFYLVKEISESKPNFAWTIAGIAAVLVYNYQLNRKDLNFISKHFGQPGLQAACNYNLTILPVSVALALNKFWVQALLLHLLATLSAFADIRTKNLKLLFINKYVPSQHFEWLSGLRKNFFLLCLLFIIACVLSPVKLFGLVALFMFNFIVLGFYGTYEPLLMLNPQHLPLKNFLKTKITFLCRVILLLNGPLLLVNAVFHPEIAWLNAGFAAAFLLLAAGTVYIKYAGFRPNDSMGFSIDWLVLTASVFLPYLIPLGLLIFISNRKKAINNLLNYSDDTD